MKDYLGSIQLDRAKDVLQYGVPGMKWGQRRSSSQLRSAAAQRAANAPSGPSKPPSGSETPATRYARLKVQAKAGGASQLSDEDLKFFNARTEALKKIEQMNKVNPGWLSVTSKKVLQETAEQQMKTIAKGIADKYISGPIVDNIGKHVSKEAKKAAEKTAQKAISS